MRLTGSKLGLGPGAEVATQRGCLMSHAGHRGHGFPSRTHIQPSLRRWSEHHPAEVKPSVTNT